MLSKKDLLNLVMGTTPNNDITDYLSNNNYGNYCGCVTNEWVWEYPFLRDLNEEELWELYLMCKK